jgi:hypothetical protein
MEVVIEAAVAYRLDHGVLGGHVGLGQSVRVAAIISCPDSLRVFDGDTFKAAFEVGSSSNEAEYGASGGVDYTVTWARVQQHIFVGLTAANRHYYAAYSSVQRITCDDNRLKYQAISGKSSDWLTIRSYTAAMRQNHLIVRQVDRDPMVSNLLTSAFKGLGALPAFQKGDVSRWYYCDVLSCIYDPPPPVD